MKGINSSNFVRSIMGARLKEARSRSDLHLSRQKLADLISQNEKAPIVDGVKGSVSPDRLKQWEYGNNPIDLEWIPAICDVLSCDVGYLFGDYEELRRETSDAVKETGLTVDAVEQLRRIASSPQKYRLEIISYMIESNRYSIFLTDHIRNSCRKTRDFILAYRTYQKELKRKEELTGGDLVKEVSLLDAGKLSPPTMDQHKLAEIADSRDAAIIRTERQFSELLKDLISKITEGI